MIDNKGRHSEEKNSAITLLIDRAFRPRLERSLRRRKSESFRTPVATVITVRYARPIDILENLVLPSCQTTMLKGGLLAGQSSLIPKPPDFEEYHSDNLLSLQSFVKFTRKKYWRKISRCARR